MSLPVKYIKSASFNSSIISQKTERILKLIFFPIWGIALVITLLLLIQVADSTLLYFRSIKLKNKYQKELTNNRQGKELRDKIIEASKHPAKGLNNFIDSINKGKPNSNVPVISPGFASQLKESSLSEESPPMDLQAWREVGIDNPSPYNDKMPDEAISMNLSGITTKLLYIIIINSLIFILPWLLIRAIYWIKLADKLPR